jgi:hypothetical protein
MNRRYKNIARAILAVVTPMVLGLTNASAQQATATQVLTLQVVEANKIDISLKAVTLVIDQASIESGSPVEAVNEDGVLVWVTNGDSKKITVVSNNPSPRFQVKLQAVNVAGSAGVAAPEAVLSDNTTKDLISGISRSSGRCKIRMTASAKVANGVGTETYAITYTVTGG